MFARLAALGAFTAIALLVTAPAQAAPADVGCLVPYKTQPYEAVPDVQATVDGVAACTYHTDAKADLPTVKVQVVPHVAAPAAPIKILFVPDVTPVLASAHGLTKVSHVAGARPVIFDDLQHPIVCTMQYPESVLCTTVDGVAGLVF